jgi:flavodoxin
MKTEIYYFTGTGNSLAVAKDLAKELQGDVKLIPVAKLLCMESIAVNADAVGIIYPAWLHHVPPMIEEFINKMLLKSPYVFAICTYAVQPYNSIFNLNSLLEQKGSRLDAGFAIAMAGKYVLLKDLTFTDDEITKRFTEEKRKVKEIAQIVNARKTVGIEGNYDESDKEKSKWLIDHHRNEYKVAEKFWLTDGCDSCGLCVELCPRNNIKLANAEPTWGNICDYCLACLHLCPKQVIQNGDITQNCKRQRHPNISVEEIIGQKGTSIS